MDPQQAAGHLCVATKEPFVPQDADRERPEWFACGEAPHHRESPILGQAHGPTWPYLSPPCPTNTSESGFSSSFQQGPPSWKLTTVRCEGFPHTESQSCP